MKINLNQECTVVLQQRGVEAINKYWTFLELTPPIYRVGDSYTAPLWDIMTVFGSECYMGPMPPFETTFDIEPFHYG